MAHGVQSSQIVVSTLYKSHLNRTTTTIALYNEEGQFSYVLTSCAKMYPRCLNCTGCEHKRLEEKKCLLQEDSDNM